MKKTRDPQRGKLSFGTVFMLCLLSVTLIGTVLVFSRLSSGASVDLKKLNMNILNLQDDLSRPDKVEHVEEPVKQDTAVSQKPSSATVHPEEEKADSNEIKSITLTVGGSVSLSGEVRKNSWNADSKIADYADAMILLVPKIQSDVNIVFAENIITDLFKASDNVAPESAAALLKDGGFSMAACGFGQAYANGPEGVEATIAALSRKGISALGIRSGEYSGIPEIKTIRGIKIAFLQYTSNIASKTRKSMEKAGTSAMVPEAEPGLIADEIKAVRSQGAEAVIVLVNWGKTGKDPDKGQKELAEQIAMAGADLIIGNGSHVPQKAEYLSGNNSSVLCVWSLGTLLGGDRSNIKRMSGYLLHVTVRSNEKGGVDILNPEFTPVYTWKYKQDGRYYYKCVLSGGEKPDGMDNEQEKTMAKSAESVRNILNDSPLTESE